MEGEEPREEQEVKVEEPWEGQEVEGEEQEVEGEEQEVEGEEQEVEGKEQEVEGAISTVHTKQESFYSVVMRIVPEMGQRVKVLVLQGGGSEQWKVAPPNSGKLK